MRPTLLLLLLLSLLPAQAQRHVKARPSHPATYIRGQWHPHPSLAQMKERFRWVQAQNRAEHFPRWKYAGKRVVQK